MFARTARPSFFQPVLLLVLQAAALWPIWVWYVHRIGDGSDEPWGLLALAAVLLLAFGERDNLNEEPRPALLLAAGALTVLGASVTSWVPALVRAGLGVTALGLCFTAIHNRSRPLAPLMALLLLSLPVIASLQFYAGYPLRAVTAWCSSGLLRLAGLAVEQSGASLTWMGRVVLVDAPCSGIHMLWVGMFLTALLSYFMRAGLLRFLLNGSIAVVLLIAGNVLRNTVLFVKESGLVPLPEWTHSAVGIALFVATSLLISLIVCGRQRAHQ